MNSIVIPAMSPLGANLRRAARTAAISSLALILASCNSYQRRDVAGWSTADPTQNHPIIVDRKEVVLDLAVPPGSYGLTHSQKRDLHGFSHRFRRDDSGGVLVVRAPVGGANEIAAMRAMDDVRRVISRAGVGGNGAVFESYSSAGMTDAPVRVSFMRHTAEAPVCGAWPTNLARDPQNAPWPNLGCATQANLAAMVSNPRDLVEPRGQTPRSSERRDVTWDKYVKGETTAAEKNDEEKAVISDVEGGGK